MDDYGDQNMKCHFYILNFVIIKQLNMQFKIRFKLWKQELKVNINCKEVMHLQKHGVLIG